MAHIAHHLNPRVVAELDLARHGLKIAQPSLGAVALDEAGSHLTFTGNKVAGAVTEQDAAAYTRFYDQMGRFKPLLERLYDDKPPLLNGERKQLWPLIKFGWQMRRLGRADMREFLRITGTNIFDILDEHLDGDLIKGAISLDAVMGNHLGPRSANTIFTYLHRITGQASQVPEGGMGALTVAMRKAAEANGADVRTGAEVVGIVVDQGKVVGVELADGERIDASRVVSNADPKTTYLKLLGARHLEADFAKRIHNLRMRGNAAKLHLALNAPPEFTGLDSAMLNHRLLIAPSAARVDRAFDSAKYGEYSPEPVMEISIPSVSDPGLAPQGHHVLSAIVQYAPYDLKAGWSDAKAQFLETVLDRLAAYAPGIREQIVHSEILTPQDLETEYRMTGGHWHHGELALDAFLMLRPVPGAAQYASPVSGLYLCGAGAHPGGGVMGSAGRNAANVVMGVANHV